VNEIVIYSKNEEGKAFVHALCGRHNSSEQKRPYSRVLYLVLFDTSPQSECNFVFKILNKSHFWTDLLLWKK
jgi:hypothetical protein